MVWVLVSGTRCATQDKHAEIIERTIRQLAEITDETKDVNVVCGDAAGVDTIIARICCHRGWIRHQFKAQWSLHGKSAGPRRNQAMIDAHGHRLDATVVFPAANKDSKGTRDLFDRAFRLKKTNAKMGLFTIPIDV
jgi:hypothetical protein